MRVETIRYANKLNLKFYRPSNKVVKRLGQTLIIVGLTTSFMPTGSIFMVAMGLPMIGIKLSPNPLKSFKIVKGYMGKCILDCKFKLAEWRIR